MLDYMRVLQDREFPMPDRSREEEELRSIHQELKGRLEVPERARLQCLMDKAKALQKLVADDNFAAGFRLGWAVRKELGEVMGDGEA